jgi:trk system potassium uptake protein TrkA
MKAPAALVGKNLKQLDFRARYKCNVLAIKTGEHMNISPYAEDVIRQHDVLVIVGKNNDLGALEIALAEEG